MFCSAQYSLARLDKDIPLQDEKKTHSKYKSESALYCPGHQRDAIVETEETLLENYKPHKTAIFAIC